MSKGKGGETEMKLDPEFKSRILKTFDRGDKLSQTAPIPYQGLTLAAPSDATKHWMTQTNDAANLLGVGMAGSPLDSLPKNERDMGGLKGYRAHRGYVQELQRAHREYPEKVAALNALMPGLLDPPKVHQGNQKMFPGSGPSGGAGNQYQNIVDMYRRYRRF
jgi:hypothetical protein